MKTIIILATAMVLLIGLTATPAMAADATAAVDINSAYVWRGQTFNDGAVIQPSIDVAAENGLGFNVWGNYDLGDYDDTLDTNEFSEIDLTVSYSKTFGKLDVSAGIISYLFPAGASETAELYVSLGMPIIGGLSAGLTAYYDIDALDDFSYANFSIGYAFDITEKFSMEAGGTLGYAGDDFSEAAGGEDGGLYDYTLSLSLGYAINEAFSASAGITYVDALDDDNLSETEDGGLLDTNVVYGIGIAYAF